MDIEKLKAIIRLANNNPNDNEANLAARKACKILAENDFAILRPTRTVVDKLNQHAQNYAGPKTWGDVKRSTEPAWKSKPPPSGGSMYDDWYDLYRRAYKAPIFTYNVCTKCQKKVPTTGEVISNFVCAECAFKNVKKERPSAIRKCTKCGYEVSTYRVKENPFVCSPCHWADAP